MYSRYVTKTGRAGQVKAGVTKEPSTAAGGPAASVTDSTATVAVPAARTAAGQVSAHGRPLPGRPAVKPAAAATLLTVLI
ncbi:MAG: hypothetical protein ACRDNZ_04845, partial [Streptosporangiaceae bacterium]